MARTPPCCTAMEVGPPGRPDCRLSCGQAQAVLTIASDDLLALLSPLWAQVTVQGHVWCARQCASDSRQLLLGLPLLVQVLYGCE